MEDTTMIDSLPASKARQPNDLSGVSSQMEDLGNSLIAASKGVRGWDEPTRAQLATLAKLKLAVGDMEDLV
jgi:hypothetical protein